MEHVSTLCALSTVSIAATGLALGRVDHTLTTKNFRRQTLPLHDQSVPVTPVTNLTLSDARPKSAQLFSSTVNGFSPNFDGSLKDGDSLPSLGRDDGQDLQRESAFGIVRRRRRGQTMTNLPLRAVDDQPAARHSRRPSSSWLRRLSGVSYQTESVTSPSPLSPSIDGSTTPILSRPVSQRRAPNKLVKRPPSQNTNVHPSFHRSSLSNPPPSALRRPATSHQRSESMRFQASVDRNSEAKCASGCYDESTIAGTSGEKIGFWRPYFTPSSDVLQDRWVHRLSTTARPRDQAIRRISPDKYSVPALVLATSVTDREYAPNTELDQFSYPQVQFRDPFKAADIAPKLADPPFERDRNKHQPSDSIGEEDPGTSMVVSHTEPAHDMRSDSLAQEKGRGLSTPMSEVAKPERTTLTPLRTHRRRNITDPNVFRRPQTASASGLPVSLPPQIRQSSGSSVAFSLAQEYRERPSTSDAAARSPMQSSSYRPGESNPSPPIRQRTKRLSIAASDPASTLIGSDDTRIFTSGDEDETDFLSDTAFDSVRTRATFTSNCGHGGSRDTIFDDANPALGPMKEGQELAKLEDLISQGSFHARRLSDQSSRMHHSNRNSLSTETQSPEALNDSHPRAQVYEKVPIGSAVSLSNLSDDQDARSLVGALPSELNGPFLRLPAPLANGTSGRSSFFAHGISQNTNGSAVHSDQSDSGSLNDEALDTSPRMNLFDWSEQPRIDREMSGSDARPSTVHGKQGGDTRGSRKPGRKGASKVHARSQSVPVTRESTTEGEQLKTSGKYSTWTLGNKGVTEDWDDDFDFGDADESRSSESEKPDEKVGGRGMLVPKAIMERQASVCGQYGQVQELMVLVEEMKLLLHRASVLQIINGPYYALWKEAEDIISLATVGDEKRNQSPPRSPSSLSSSFDEPGEESPPKEETPSGNSSSNRNSEELWQAPLPEQMVSGPKTSSGDPDLDSAMRAKSVLDLINEQRAARHKSYDVTSPSQKVVFDTQSLRDLVMRSHTVHRLMKRVIREAEGITDLSKDDKIPSDPPFSRIFDQSSTGHSSLETHCVS